MSPRSAELLAGAREALRGARAALDADAPARAASAAYYAMLYAARAALSEEDANAKTHRGTWHLFHERFVAGGQFEHRLYAEAQRAQDVRELGDYSAQPPSGAEAGGLIAVAERFVDAVASMLGE
jgi:uncharacterized protein (UPF0332 family)